MTDRPRGEASPEPIATATTPAARGRAFEVSPRLAVVLLLLMVLASLVLRAHALDRLGLWIDEDLTALIARAIRDGGWPLLPSEQAYTRGALYSYIVAGAIALLGDAEWSLRLPSVLFSLGTIVVGYLYASALGGRTAGLVAAAILAASPWELHYARMARMYAFLGLLVLSGVYLVHRGWILGSRRACWGAALVAALTVPVHQLGAIFALVFLLPHLPAGERRAPASSIEPSDLRAAAPGTGAGQRCDPGMQGTRAGLLASLGAIAILALAMAAFSFYQEQARARGVGGLDLVVDAGAGGGSLSLPVLPPISLNYSRLLVDDFAKASPVSAAVAVSGLVLATILATFALRSRSRLVPGSLSESGGRETASSTGVATRLFTGILWIAFVAMLWANQLVLAAVAGLAVWLRSRRTGTWLPLALAGAFAVAAFFSGQALAEGTGSLSSRGFLRLFFALPEPFYRLLAVHYPVLFAALLAAGVVAFRKGLRQRDDGRLLLVTVVLGLLLGMGLFRSPYVIHRYTFYLNGLLVVSYAVAATDLAGWLERRARGWRSGAGARFALPAAAACVVLAVLVSGQFAPIESWRATQVSAGFGREALSDPDLTSHFRYDFRGAAAYLAQHARPEDQIVSKDPVELRAYGIASLARINQLYSVYAWNESREPMDWYLRIPILDTQEKLATWIRAAHEEGRRVFIVFPQESKDGPQVHLPPEMKSFLSGSLEREVFRAADGVTTVLRFDP